MVNKMYFNDVGGDFIDDDDERPFKFRRAPYPKYTPPAEKTAQLPNDNGAIDETVVEAEERGMYK
jgi:hypothetical protein